MLVIAMVGVSFPVPLGKYFGPLMDTRVGAQLSTHIPGAPVPPPPFQQVLLRTTVVLKWYLPDGKKTHPPQ
jgi:hypothetical protein